MPGTASRFIPLKTSSSVPHDDWYPPPGASADRTLLRVDLRRLAVVRRRARVGAQPSPPNTPAAVSYLIPLRTFPAGDWPAAHAPKRTPGATSKGQDRAKAETDYPVSAARSGPSPQREDVLVHMEEVVGIVLCFDFSESPVILP